jgi:hypothetical protein
MKCKLRGFITRLTPKNGQLEISIMLDKTDEEDILGKALEEGKKMVIILEN